MRRRILGSVLMTLGCAVGCMAPAPTPLDSEAVAGEALAALRTFESQLNAAEYDKALAFYANDERFVAYENGEPRYTSWEQLRDVYAALPDYGKGVFRYPDAEVTAIDIDHAYLATGFWTSFGEEGAPGYFQFEGRLTALLHRTPNGWAMLKIHSSSLPSPGGRDGGGGDPDD